MSVNYVVVIDKSNDLKRMLYKPRWVLHYFLGEKYDLKALIMMLSIAIQEIPDAAFPCPIPERSWSVLQKMYFRDGPTSVDIMWCIFLTFSEKMVDTLGWTPICCRDMLAMFGNILSKHFLASRFRREQGVKHWEDMS